MFKAIQSLFTSESKTDDHFPVPPKFARTEAENKTKIAEYISWYIQNDPSFAPVEGVILDMLFVSEGMPGFVTSNPPSTQNIYKSFKEWILNILTLDISEAVNFSDKEFERLLDELIVRESMNLKDLQNIAIKFYEEIRSKDFKGQGSVDYSVSERKSFRQNFYYGYVLILKQRILNELYYEWYGTRYRDEDR